MAAPSCGQAGRNPRPSYIEAGENRLSRQQDGQQVPEKIDTKGCGDRTFSIRATTNPLKGHPPGCPAKKCVAARTIKRSGFGF
jgi:hypothetical protein